MADPGRPRARGWRGLARALLIRHAPRLACRLAGPSRAELGLLGEELAARWLRTQRIQPIGRRVRTVHGEIDILAREGPCLVLVEVKTTRAVRRPDARWRPADRFDHVQRRRLARAARWLAKGQRREPPASTRVDLIEVWIAPLGGRHELIHHQDGPRGDVD